MKQVQLSAPRKIEVFDIDKPKVESGWVLAKTMRTGICGTDVHSYMGETIFGKVFPFHIGHEICAIVEETASDCKTLKKGDVIVVNPFFTCGACPACYMGNENNCANRTTIGLKGYGGFSEYVYVPVTSAFKVNSTDYTTMCLAEPLSTVIYGFDKLRINNAYRVLIQGVGSIGMMFVQLCAAANLSQVVVSDFNKKKLEIAKKLGADVALCPLDENDKKILDAMSFDIIIDCTGSIKSMQTTVDRVSFGGQILLFGLCSAEQEMVIKPFRLYQKDASIMTSFALNRASFRKAIALLEKGFIRSDLIIDSVQPFEKLEDSILSISKGESVGKIVIDTSK